MRTPLKSAPKRGSMNPLTPDGSGDPPDRLRWISEVAKGAAAAAEAEAARWMALPQAHDPPVAPQAQRWTIAGPLDA